MDNNDEVARREKESSAPPPPDETAALQRLRELLGRQNKRPNDTVEKELRQLLAEQLSAADAFVDALLANKDEKAKALQIAVAGNLVAQHPAIAARLLGAALSHYTRNLKSWIKMSQEVKRNIARAFLYRKERWIPFAADDAPVGDFLLSFIDVFTDQNFYQQSNSKRYLRDFALWAMAALAHLPVDAAIRREALQRLNNLANSLPEEFANAVNARLAVEMAAATSPPPSALASSPQAGRAAASESLPPIPPTVSAALPDASDAPVTQEAQDQARRQPATPKPPPIAEESAAPPSPPADFDSPPQLVKMADEATALAPADHEHLANTAASADEQLDAPVVMSPAMNDPFEKTAAQPASEPAALLLSSAMALLRQKEAEIEQRRLEVELLSQLLAALGSLRDREAGLTAELQGAQQQAATLQAANESLDQQRRQALQAQRAANEARQALEEKFRRLEAELRQQQAARELDRQRYGERLERESREAVNGFKGKLGSQLRHVFAKKRSRENQPLSDKLAESLLHYFQELEETLTRLDIRLS